MKVALLGGGGFRTPLTVHSLVRARPRLDVHEIALHDLDASRLGTMSRVIAAMQPPMCGGLPIVSATTDLELALRDAAFVLIAIRVGGLRARAMDERLAIEAGLVGQETVGAGGLCLLMRSVSMMADIAEAIARLAPNAWVINFTNPVGAICGVLRERLGNRVIGVCDTPADLIRRIAALLGEPADALCFDYFGLNHLGWVRSVIAGGRNRLDELLANDARLEQLEETRLFGAAWLRRVELIPIEYLTYYYFPERHLEAVAAAGHSRAEFLLESQQQFYSTASDPRQDAFELWQAARAKRDQSYFSDATTSNSPRISHGESEGYAAVAVATIESLATGVPSRGIVDVENGRTLPFLPPPATVEVRCTIDARGATPYDVEPVPEHASALMRRVYEAEQAAISAVRSGSQNDAVEALASHPLVDSMDRAQRVFGACLQQHPELAERFK